MTNITPSSEIEHKILQAKQFSNIAQEIETNILNANLEIKNLTVSVDGDTVSLTGETRLIESKDNAEKIALQQPEIQSISNGITVLEEKL